MKLDTPRIKEIIAKHNLYLCQECGKCSASCPRLLNGQQYSPRLLAQKLINQPSDAAYIQAAVWECLTCGRCQERCPSGVQYLQLILDLRAEMAAQEGLLGYRAHDGAVHSWMRIMTAPELKQNRTEWLTSDLKVREKGEVAYFVGCAPYFDIFFAGIEVDTLAGARGALTLLNHLGIEPVVLGSERCCGHDLLYSGDRANFEALCRLNHQEFKAAGVKEIIVSCPECHLVLSQFLPQVVPGCDLKVTLLLDLLETQVGRGILRFKPLEQRVTYQDPCRLARMSDCLEAPRQLLKALPGLELAEMESHGRSALCCGNSAFVNCDAFSKRIQVQRLLEAQATGAAMLVTACPKCLIHLGCAMRDPYRGGSLALPARDLASLLAQQLDEGH